MSFPLLRIHVVTKSIKSNPLVLLSAFLLLSALLCVTDNVFAKPKLEFPGVVWERNFGDDKYWDNPSAMALSPDRDILIAGTSTIAGGSGKSGSFWVWRIDQNGQKTRELPIKNPDASKRLNPAYSYIKSMIVFQNGEVLLVVEFSEGRSSLVKLSKKGELLFVKALGEPESNTVIFKIIPIGNEHFFLIGRRSDDALVIKTDALGNRLWEKILDRGKVEYFIDGLSTEGEGIVVIGNRGVPQQFFMGSSDIWILEIGSKGEIQSEKTFPGRNPSVVKVQDGSYMVLYDKSDSMSQDIRVKKLKSDLKEKWETQLLNLDMGLTRFRMVTVSSTSFVVAGSKASKVWVSGIDSEGKKVWNFLDDSVNRTSWHWNCIDLLSSNGEVIILTSVYSENDRRQVNNKIGLIKFI